jgi:site-specific DNA recombinase
MMRIALYVRVSTSNQVHQQTIKQQLERLRGHLQTQDQPLEDELIFRDDGYSGARLTRPGLDRLRDAVRERRVDRLVLTAPDRLARNYVHQMLLLEEFEQYGCAVEFLDRPMSHDPHDQWLLQIRGAVAEYERTLITDRMRRGRQAKLRAGVLLPWVRAPYGYHLHPDRPRDPAGVTLEPSEAAVVAEMFALYLSPGAGLFQVARMLRERQIPSPTGKPVWGLATVRGILSNPVYTGQVYAGRMVYRPARIRRSATHPMGRPRDSGTLLPASEWIPVAQVTPLISQEQFDLVQSKLAKNQSFAGRNNTAHAYLLRAMVSCGHCQRACIGRTLANSPYSYYVCSSKIKAASQGREPCSARFSPAGQLDALVWQDLCEVLTHPDELTHALERAHGGHSLPQELQARRENLRQGRRSLSQQLDRLTEAYLHSVIPLPEYERRRRELEQRDHALAEQETQLSAQAHKHTEVAGLAVAIDDFCARVRDGLANASFEQKRSLIELLIDRVIVADSEVEIRYVIPTHPRSKQVRFCHLRTDYFRAPHPVGSDHRNATQQIRIDRVFRARTAGVRPRRHARQSHQSHQASYALAIDRVVRLLKEDDHPAGAVKRVPGVLLVNQPTVDEIAGIDHRWAALRIDRGAAYPRQSTLLNHVNRIARVDPPVTYHGRLIPDFFFSQSSSIFNCPIALYNSSGSRCAAAGLGPRLPSNSVLAFSWMAFFHCPTWTGCTPYSRPISLIVLTPRTTSRPTLALNSGVSTFRVVTPLIASCSP